MSKRRSSLVSTALAVLLSAMLLAACGRAPGADAPTTTKVEGQVHVEAAFSPILGAALAIMNLEEMGPTAVTRVAPGIYLGPVSPADGSGSLSFELPAGTDLPAQILRPVEAAVLNVEFMADCQLVATDPSVQVSVMMFELAAYPSVAVLTAEGAVMTLVLAEEVALPLDEAELIESRIQTWTYASAPTNLVTEAGSCLTADDTVFLDVDVTLAAGWNQLEWTVSVDGMGDPASIALRNSAATQVYIYPVPDF